MPLCTGCSQPGGFEWYTKVCLWPDLWLEALEKNAASQTAAKSPVLQTQCCVLMLDLDDAEDLVSDMFRLCFLIFK